MPTTYTGIKHLLQPPLDCAEIKDLRGRHFHNRQIINYENTDFTGCVQYHCYPSGIPGATECNSAKSEEEVTLKGADLSGANLYEANLLGANLLGANLQGACYSEGTVLPDSITQKQLDSMTFVEDNED